MDRLKSLSTFVQVVENGGFSAAARHLNMSPSMASEHVQALEEQLGARLLQRTTRKVSLTEAGQAYYENAARILAELEEADRRVGALQSTPRGRLRLHVGTHIIRFVTPILADYMKLYPDLTVDLTMGERMVDLVEEGFDLAIRATVPADSSLVIRQLSAWRHVPCAAHSYLEAHGRPAHPSDLANHNCLRYAFYPYGEDWRFTGPDGAPVSARVKGSLRTNSAEALRIAAIEGIGIFLAPSFLVTEDLDAGRLVPLLDGVQARRLRHQRDLSDAPPGDGEGARVHRSRGRAVQGAPGLDGAPARRLSTLNELTIAFAGPPAKRAIGARGSGFGLAGCFPPASAQARGHPPARSKKSFEQRRDVEIGVQSREMQAEAGRADLDLFQVPRRRRFKPVRIARTERDRQTSTQLDNNLALALVELRGHGARRRPSAQDAPRIRLGQLVTVCHASRSIPRKASAGCRPARTLSSATRATGTRNSPAVPAVPWGSAG